ncbi:PQ loop repeat protein [Histoplasma capsulatum G186AR]|uniref:PQ loop repeat protein n=1 Tax=Ajellomyces capsulatus TaxID=5037 RepID=A0A8H7YJ14_AJECA|nr:PQ loop repeat protein [Histoplasma capsulatum]QSS72800.1 PQ loop repeat protein [Histoplasma capsulatum G186AR]
MMILWAIAGVPLGTYNIVEEFNIALRIQPQILTLLSLATWTQCMYYGKKWPVKKCLITVFILCAVFGGVQAALIFLLRIAKHHEVQWPITMMAILSACLLVAGVLRHYWDIYIHRTVRGISFLFVAIDAAGDLFSLVSILYQPTLDILGMAIYGSELAFWLGICACGFFMNFSPWIKKKARAWGYRAEEESRSEENEPATQQPQQIYLQEVPSSTSVFQTASGTTDTLRRRDTVVQEP